MSKRFPLKVQLAILIALWTSVVIVSAVVVLPLDSAPLPLQTISFENNSWYIFSGNWTLYIYSVNANHTAPIDMIGKYYANNTGILNVTLTGNLNDYGYVALYSVTMGNITFNTHAYGFINSSFIELTFNDSAVVPLKVI